MSYEENIQIFLSSRNASRFNNGLTSDCDFYLPMMELPSQHYAYVSLVQASIPYTFYNVNSSNNTMRYMVNGVPTTVTIAAGNYNCSQMIAWFAANRRSW